MKRTDRICQKVTIKSSKDREAYLRRQENHIVGTPKIILAKQFQNNVQEIWVDDLKSEPVARLKQLNTDERAFQYASIIINTASKLSARYGYFILNENMIFFNERREVFVWINPDIFENNVKIYLPNSQDGELMMIRSILSYLRLWLRCDYLQLTDSKKLQELAFKFEQIKNKASQEFKPKSPEKMFLTNSGNTSNLGKTGQVLFKGMNPPPVLKRQGNNLINENRSNRQMKSPTKQQQKLILSMSNKQKNTIKNYSQLQQTLKFKNRTTEGRNTEKKSSDKNVEEVEGNFQHKSFNTLNSSIKLTLNKSQGIKSGNYFPNRSTSNKNHIVELITSMSDDKNGQQFKQNNILLQDEVYQQQLERQRIKKMKDSLQGIGQQVNELFFSNIESQDGNQDELKMMQQEFGNLLN